MKVLIVNTSEVEFVKLLRKITDKTIIDFVRIDDALLEKENYIGINWGNQSALQQNFISKEDANLINRFLLT